HHKQRGDETFFLTGTDEHGSKVSRAAEEQGLDPRTYVDQIAEAWKELPRRVDADYDFFIRTTDEGHKRFVQEFIQRIYDNGYIYQDVYAGLYCVGCEAFKTEAELVDGKCPDHGIVPEWIEETNYFFKLSAFQDRLLELYDTCSRRTSCVSTASSGPHSCSPRTTTCRSSSSCTGISSSTIARSRSRSATSSTRSTSSTSTAATPSGSGPPAPCSSARTAI